jgi:hypothetical protein
MSPDEQLVLIFGLLHLAALVLGGVLFAMFLRSDTAPAWKPPEDDDSGGGGGNDRISDKPKTSPSGGIPLPDAEPARMRLRTRHDRLADPGRRPVRRAVPERPHVRPGRRVPQR